MPNTHTHTYTHACTHCVSGSFGLSTHASTVFPEPWWGQYECLIRTEHSAAASPKHYVQTCLCRPQLWVALQKAGNRLIHSRPRQSLTKCMAEVTRLSLQELLSFCFFGFGMSRSRPQGEILELSTQAWLAWGFFVVPSLLGPSSPPERLWTLCVWLRTLPFLSPASFSSFHIPLVGLS